MDLRESQLLKESQAEHWYYAAKAAAMTKLIQHIPESILDVGAGSAFFSKHLLQHSGARSSRCIDPNYPRDEDLLFYNKPLHLRQQPSFTHSEQLVLMMDVLEHVPNDLGLLKYYVDRVAPGTTFLITVPAFQWLWSGHDEFLGHYRRYTLPQLEQTVLDAGLILQKGCYFFAAALPLAAMLRLIARIRPKKHAPASQLQSHASWFNALLKLICRLELNFMHANRIGGLTVFCLAHKPLSTQEDVSI